MLKPTIAGAALFVLVTGMCYVLWSAADDRFRAIKAFYSAQVFDIPASTVSQQRSVEAPHTMGIEMADNPHCDGAPYPGVDARIVVTCKGETGPEAVARLDQAADEFEARQQSLYERWRADTAEHLDITNALLRDDPDNVDLQWRAAALVNALQRAIGPRIEPLPDIIEREPRPVVLAVFVMTGLSVALFAVVTAAAVRRLRVN